MKPTDFRVKGFHLDLRIQVMPLPALRTLAAELAAFGLNTLLIEWEATYPYQQHAIISNEYAYTREEIESFLAYCATLGLDVIPLQQCFGHVEYILRHERYAHLRESQKDISQFCPMKQAATHRLVFELLADVAATHRSEYLHIGGDETYLLGHCPRCRAKAGRAGLSRLYVDFFKGIAHRVVKLGKRPLLWADMLLKYPDAAGQMPKETIFVDWNYGWRPNHFGDITKIQRLGFEVWGAAALRAHPDNHSLTDWKTHFQNIRAYVPYARRQGYAGLLMTSWSTSGVYGYEWDQKGEVLEMHTMRHVYPLAGFRILQAAYAESLRDDRPLTPQKFVQRYAAERFGLPAADGAKLWQVLAREVTEIKPGDEIAGPLADARQAQSLLASLAPRRQLIEFEHLRLMADLREFHLRFKQLERQIQAGRASGQIRALARLIEESELLDQRFIKANRGFLHEKALAEEIIVRSKKLRRLYDRLTRAGRRSCQPTAAPALARRSGVVRGLGRIFGDGQPHRPRPLEKPAYRLSGS
jgi:hexosaminidase